MSRYDPKIYIRDYGTPTRRILWGVAKVSVSFGVLALKRALVMRIENRLAGEPGLLLSGDAQVTGNDVLLLSGAGGRLVLSTDSNVRVRLNDVRFQTFPGLLLSGDAQQTGHDVLLLSGSGGRLVLSGDADPDNFI